MKLNTDRNCHAKYNIKLHIILVTKYRRECITPEIFEFLKENIIRLSLNKNIIVEEINYEPDHIHMLLSFPPQIAPATFINTCKSVTSRLVRKEFSEYLATFYWKPYFWSRSYLVLSCGGAPIEVIKAYIREQGTEEHKSKKAARQP